MTEKSDKKSSRILTFDLLRGYFLVAILMDHLNFFPNGLDWWSARGSLFVTTAEGFFFISGLILGVVRGAKLTDKPFGHVAKLLLKRGLQLYLTTVILVLIFTFVGWWWFMGNPNLKAGISPPTDFFTLLAKTLSFQYFYGWADYLRLYAIFLFASPIVMWLLRRKKWYIALLLSISVWLFFPNDPGMPDDVQELLQPLSWQLLFFGGMIVGFYWNTLTAWWSKLPALYKKVAVTSTLCLAGMTLCINGLIVFGTPMFDLHAIGIWPDTSYKLYTEFFDKERLPVARILLFIVWFWAAFYLFRRFEPYIMRWIGWLILPFGTNSLYVYTVQAFLLFFVHLWIQNGTIFQNFIVTVALIALIRIMIHYKVLMKIIPR